MADEPSNRQAAAANESTTLPSRRRPAVGREQARRVAWGHHWGGIVSAYAAKRKENAER